MTNRSTSTLQMDVRPIRRLLQINVCVLFCLAGVIFAAAEGSPLGLLSVPIAVTGLLLTDRREVLGLSVLWANLLGLGAFIAAGYEFFHGSIEGRLLGFGHLLLYLGWILMLQRKGKPQFWWLCALSTLQVATSSVLTNDVWFPLSAMLFMMGSLWTLSVFSLDRAVTRSAGVERSARQAVTGRPSAGSTNGAMPPGDGVDTSRSRSNVRSESASRWVTPRFVVGVLLNTVLSLLLGLAIFILTPRIWAGSFNLFSDTATQPLTGFAEEVSLGDMGEILENPDIVLEVEFFNHQTNERLDVEATMAEFGYDAPVFRGKVMGGYGNGRWSTPALSAPTNRFRVPSWFPLVRQEIVQHPIGTRTLFAAHRPMGGRSDTGVGIVYERLNGTLSIESDAESRDAARRVFRYEAFAPMSDASMFPWGQDRSWLLLGEYHATMLDVPGGLERLVALTRELTRPADGTILSEREVADILVQHLRSSGEYAYSLKVAIHDPSIDPVEDFLFNRKEGHCEYFASALALMLRSARIPARLISGFKGGALNSSTGKFEVRQLHAHAWVEALIDNDWVVLDATPAGRDVSVASISTAVSPAARLKQAVNAWWSRGLTLNQLQQRRMIYEPIRDVFGSGLESVRRVGLVSALAEWFRQLSADPGEWISWRGFFTVFALCLLLVIVAGGVRSSVRWARGLALRRGTRGAQHRRVVAFYERFLQLVGRQGFLRDDATTQREFAEIIERDWRHRAPLGQFVQIPLRLTDAFYRVRFGDETLNDVELESLEAALTDLEAEVHSRGATA